MFMENCCRQMSDAGVVLFTSSVCAVLMALSTRCFEAFSNSNVACAIGPQCFERLSFTPESM